MSLRAFLKTTVSIKTRLLGLLLFMTAVATASIAGVAIYVNQMAARSAQLTSGQALVAQAKDYLVQLTQSNARETDHILDEVKRQTQNIASYASMVFDQPERFGGTDLWKAHEHMHAAPEGQYVNTPQDLSSVYVPKTTPIDQATVKDIELSAHLDHLFVTIFQNIPNVEAIYFATPRDMVRYYPNIDLGSVLPPDFRATQRIWYTGSTPENNPDKKAWWTPPYVDATGLGLVTTVAAPVYSQSGEFLGVVGLDLTLKDVTANIESTRFLKSGYSFLIDNTGHAIALPEAAYPDILQRPASPQDINVDLGATTTPFAPVLKKMISGQSGFEQLTLGKRSLFVAYAPLESTGWSLGSVIEAKDILSAVTTLQDELAIITRNLILTRILPVSVVIFVLVTFLGLILANRLVVPIQKLAAEAQKVGTGRWDITIPATGNDEIGILARTFKTMAEQIHTFIRELEKRVAERTRDLERRTTHLQVAAEVAREAAAIHDLDTLLNNAVDLIRQRFGFYHAGIFLLDEGREYAVLRAATGEAGQEMIARGHKLKVGEVGMVGYVTSSGQPRIALDVDKDPTHFKNPLLPETRSEMTLPLKIGDQIIGALDVQSQLPQAFSREDIEIMQVLADQLAIAIQNARLLQETQDNLRQLEKLYTDYLKKSWQKRFENSTIVGYRYERSGVRPIYKNQNMPRTEPKPSISLPLQVRGQVIATLDAWADEGALDAEAISLLEAIANRLSQALDSARLFEETQRRAERERLAGEITAKMRASNDPQIILETAIRELRQALRIDSGTRETSDNEFSDTLDKGDGNSTG